MSVQIRTIVVGELEVNCYICFDETLEAIVVDPGSEPEKIIDFLKSKNLVVKYIVNTHGHYDHIGGNTELKDFSKAPILIHKNDADFLTDSDKNLSSFLDQDFTSYPPDKFLNENDELLFGNNNKFKIIETPGHTLGCICLLLNNEFLFTGDTLFVSAIGRTDLAHSSDAAMQKSLKKFLVLNPKLKIYPGHGTSGVLAEEFSKNPFLKSL